MEACPVCYRNLPVHDLPEHVQLHFLEQEEGQQGQGNVPIVIDDEGDDAAAGRVRCPIGCGELVLLEELDSHEEAHRLQELESQHNGFQQEQEAAEFEKLQMKFGFSDKRPGKCFRCGEEGHWSRDCPSNPAAQAARARQALSTNPADLVRVQQPEPVIRQQQQQGVDIMSMLQACFQAQQRPRTTVYLSGPVTFSCRGQDDAGWGCGYRNIQMQVSHLLATSPQHRQALFGGAGFVPNIPALQAWLEAAWQAGFDAGGAALLGPSVQCTRKWIGTTEAAAMLRYFGCRALIVDFYGKKNDESSGGPTIHQDVGCDFCGASPIVGVRYKSYNTPNFDVCSTCSQSQAAQQHAPFFESGSAGSTANGSNSASAGRAQQPAAAAAAAMSGQPGSRSSGSWSGRGQGGASSSSGQGRNKRFKQLSADERRLGADRHQALAEWIWAYFSSPGFQGVPAAAAQQGSQAAGQVGSSRSAPDPVNAFNRLQEAQRPTTVVMSGKPPLYFQHEGHSRTVVGIERTLPAAPQQHQQRQGPGSANSNGGPGGVAAAAAGPEYTLIVLDPGMSEREVLSSLRNRDNWQAKVKRGMHSLARHSELQLLYVAPGVVPEGPERDALKRVVAAERYR